MQGNLKSSTHPAGSSDKPSPDLGNVGVGEFWLLFSPDFRDVEFGRWVASNHPLSNRLITYKTEYTQLHLRGVVKGKLGSPRHVIHAVTVLEFLRALDSALSQISVEIVPDKDNPAPGASFSGVAGLDVSRDPAVPEIPVRTPGMLLKAGLITFCSGLAGMCRNLVPKRPERFTAPDTADVPIAQIPKRAAWLPVQAGHAASTPKYPMNVNKKTTSPTKTQ